MAVFANIQHCTYTYKVGGSEKVKKCANVIYGWSLGYFKDSRAFNGLKMTMNY